MSQRERGGQSRAGFERRAAASPHRPGTDLAALRGRLRTVIEPVVTAAGLDLDSLAVSRMGRRNLVRVSVDGDGGVSHDTLTELSRDLSTALDDAEAAGASFGPDPYTLEVSSPGVDRPLTQPRHWRRNIGRLVTVRVGGRTLTARITAVDDTGVTLDADRAGELFRYEQLGPGHVQVEFDRLAALSDDDFGVEFTDGADELGADELGVDELGADELGVEDLGVEDLGGDELGTGPHGHGVGGEGESPGRAPSQRKEDGA